MIERMSSDADSQIRRRRMGVGPTNDPTNKRQGEPNEMRFSEERALRLPTQAVAHILKNILRRYIHSRISQKTSSTEMRSIIGA